MLITSYEIEKQVRSENGTIYQRRAAERRGTRVARVVVITRGSRLHHSRVPLPVDCACSSIFELKINKRVCSLTDIANNFKYTVFQLGI